MASPNEGSESEMTPPLVRLTLVTAEWLRQFGATLETVPTLAAAAKGAS